MRGLLAGVAIGVAGLLEAPATFAQDVASPESVVPIAAVLTVDSEVMYAQSLFGLRVSQELAAEEAVLLAENRRIQAELTEEERELTAQREGMDPKAFRAIADAFDTRVVQIRIEQEQKSRNIEVRRKRQEEEFIRAASPILTDLMREAEASVIMERRDMLLADPSIDITSVAIQRLNQRLGDGRVQGDNSQDAGQDN
ncbi:OmpH family outer membrane protein [Shimia sp. MMG029]|uniref:OmpH family outer membrane protein n=1 Tax=Shimia sp. MMG029 TaxID=3021978 RepID=UPI0022FDD82B|nr:OmpH family outer membrane protein [Shimia sp. MMG029]MDA5555464.1 OmpH family outer membrane protein [Shimia sp. MMG029]